MEINDVMINGIKVACGYRLLPDDVAVASEYGLGEGYDEYIMEARRRIV